MHAAQHIHVMVYYALYGTMQNMNISVSNYSCITYNTSDSCSFKVGHWGTKFPGSGTEKIPVKDQRFPHQNKTAGFGQWPRPLHDRYLHPNRNLGPLGNGNYILHVIADVNFLTLPLLKRLRNGRFNSESAPSESATWIQDPEVV
jgi:hypothetical protein